MSAFFGAIFALAGAGSIFIGFIANTATIYQQIECTLQGTNGLLCLVCACICLKERKEKV